MLAKAATVEDLNHFSQDSNFQIVRIISVDNFDVSRINYGALHIKEVDEQTYLFSATSSSPGAVPVNSKALTKPLTNSRRTLISAPYPLRNDSDWLPISSKIATPPEQLPSISSPPTRGIKSSFAISLQTSEPMMASQPSLTSHLPISTLASSRSPTRTMRTFLFHSSSTLLMWSPDTLLATMRNPMLPSSQF